ncbi:MULTISPECIES: hypothetical protein [unclassified Bacillus (in: firmicutes)]|uniref:hypothetical protein n=1 Tax=unclassified Bacillus (in: firmicutes) TaxID=185979 RepID=UPI0008EE77E3|nr:MULTISPECIES: hypothetical protein [unclassified Bacillus (in: firmicutes)]SFA69553.1 hypothetical protein SAMN02799634_10131 [Bacillus sp. UNCCL13]SFQ58864.1 hypothetical protein SAMN04488577_0315 [Bacillus sp. cl95]
MNIKPVLTFKTSMGSQYWLDEKGRSQRLKSFHPGHGVENQGLQEPYDHIFFVNNSDADYLDLATNHRGNWRMIFRKGKIAIITIGSDNKLSIISGPFDFSYKPKLGLAPIEIKELEYKESVQGYFVKDSFHIGNEIVKLKYLNQ